MFSDFGCKAAIKRGPSSLLEWPSVSRLARFSRAKLRKIRETSVRFAEIFSWNHGVGNHGVGSTDHSPALKTDRCFFWSHSETSKMIRRTDPMIQFSNPPSFFRLKC